MINTSGYTIDNIYTARVNVLDILKTQDYNVSEYQQFSINEVNSMFINNQLDMLIKHESNENKIYIRFNLNKLKLAEIVNDVYDVDENNISILNKESDILFIISNDNMNDSCEIALKQYWEENNIFISYVPIKSLLFNPLKHILVPHHKIIRDTNVIEQIKKKYNIKNNSEFPNIDRFDAIAKLICIKPGELCHIFRKSKTAVVSDYYRLCI
jgi:DNA-directed RNA polymerase subunit H (RpoH/RPB5)